MNTSVLIAHHPEDTELAEQIAAALQTLSAETTAVCSALSADNSDAVAIRLAASQAVIALLTEAGTRSAEVLLPVGAAWALGKRLVFLLDAARAASPDALPKVPGQQVALEADSLIELAETLAHATGGRAELGPAARLVLSELFPGWGRARESSEQPIARDAAHAHQTQELPVHTDAPIAAPAPAAAPAAPAIDAAALPRASTSLDAGRALGDAVFQDEEQPASADGLDMPFGAFLASLGGNWSSLREIPDVEVWREATENLLEGLPATAQPTRGWYEVGFHAALLLQLARRQLEIEGSDETLERRWQAAWGALREGAWRAGLPQTVVDELHAMLDNLRGPLRDFTNLGRAQARVQELATQADTLR